MPVSLLLLGFIAYILAQGIFTVRQPSVVIVERFGKFHSVRHPGLHFKVPVIDRISGKVNIQIQQLDVRVETKTKDNIFVRLNVSVQFRVLEDLIYDAFYKLENPTERITAYVLDVVHAEVPKLELDDVFKRKADIAVAILQKLQNAMNSYGYGIVEALVTDIDSNQEIKSAMNHSMKME